MPTDHSQEHEEDSDEPAPDVRCARDPRRERQPSWVLSGARRRLNAPAAPAGLDALEDDASSARPGWTISGAWSRAARCDPADRASGSRVAAAGCPAPLRRAPARAVRSGSRGAISSKCCHAENSRITTSRTPTRPTRHSSRCRASSTSRTIGLFRMSFLMAYSNGFHSRSFASGSLARQHPQLGAARSRVPSDARPRPAPRVSSSAPGDPRPATAEGPERVLHDPVLQRVKRDDRQPAARAPAARRPSRGTRRAPRARG